MIFSVDKHIQQIISGEKTQTRRKSGTYMVGKKYSIQPGGRQPGIPEGRILITKKRSEFQPNVISKEDAEAEGGYSPERFEALYHLMDRGWTVRYAYTFRFVPTAGRG